MNDEVTLYIDAAPQAQQAFLRELRAMILKALPGAEEQMGSSGFPVYTVGGRWVSGFATRKKGPMFYMMLGDAMKAHEPALRGLKSGNSCIECRETKDLPMGELKKVIRAMLADAGTATGKASTPGTG